MHRETMRLAVDQRAGVAERARMAEKRHVELLRRFVKRKKDGIVHLPLFGVTDEMGGFTAQVFDATA